MTSRRHTTSNQRWNNVVFFNVKLSNVGQRRNNVANMTIWKKIYKPRFKNKLIFLNFKEYVGPNNFLHFFPILTLSRRRPLSYRNQSIDLLRKSMDWFLYDNGLHNERVKQQNFVYVLLSVENITLLVTLTHFRPMFYFCFPWKHEKIRGFLMFAGV